MSLSVELDFRRAAFRLELAFELESGQVAALCGPSGAGKTTLLRCLAGLERPERALVRCQGAVWQDHTQGTFMSAHRRAVGFVFQETALFPHLSVRGNLEYAAKRSARRVRPSVLSDAVAWLGLEPLLERLPQTLSGGERQRVAIGRALAARPDLLLMDEPVAALDVAARGEILPNLERIFRELRVPVLYVTHALGEVVRLADRVLWLENGTLRAAGPPSSVLPELTRKGALGRLPTNVVAGVMRGPADHELCAVESGWGVLLAERLPGANGREVRLELPSNAIAISLERHADTSAANWLAAVVQDADVTGGERVTLTVAHPAEETLRLSVSLTKKAYAELELAPGKSVWLSFDALRALG